MPEESGDCGYTVVHSSPMKVLRRIARKKPTPNKNFISELTENIANQRSTSYLLKILQENIRQKGGIMSLSLIL